MNRLSRAFCATLALALAPSLASAQQSPETILGSGVPWGIGFVPTIPQWDLLFSSKFDVTGTVTGTGGAFAASLANRATDFGVTFNLKTDFGAKCDGVTDDTAAIQNWLNKAAPGVRLIAPAGRCVFESPLTTGAVGNYDIGGAGQYATTFLYAGTATTGNLLTLNSPNAAGQIGVTVHDLQIASATTMTDGYAIQANGLFDSAFNNVALDQANGGKNTLCGGLWANGAGDVRVLQPDFNGGNASCNAASGHGDGVVVNSNLGGTGDMYVAGPGIIHGFVGAALHSAGGFGGLTCKGGQTDVSHNGRGLIVDNAISATANREVKINSCAIDTNTNGGVLINDTIANGGTITLGDTIWSTQAGPGVDITSWITGQVQFVGGGSIYNNCGDGVIIRDATAKVTFDPSVYVNTNGNSGLGGACVTWQTANPGHGWGINASTPTNNVNAPVTMISNSAGTINAAEVSGLSNPTVQPPTYTASGGSTNLLLNSVSGYGAGVDLAYAGTNTWQLRSNSSNQFIILDSQNASTNWLQVLTGGAATLGEGDASTLNVLGSMTVTDTTSGDSAALTLNETNGGTGGKAASLYFEDNSVAKWQVTKDSGNTFRVVDVTNSFTSALSIAAGGDVTIGEGNTNVLTVNGSAQLRAYTVSALSAAVPCAVGTAGAIAYVTDAASPTYNAALTGGSSTKTLAMCNGTNWTAH